MDPSDILALICFITFPLFSFFGRKLYKTTVIVVGAGFGGYLAVWVLTLIRNNSSLTISMTVEYVVIAITAIVIGLLLYKLIQLGVFIIGAVGGVLIGNLAFSLYSGHFVIPDWTAINWDSLSNIQLGVLAGSALVGGLLTVFVIQRVLIGVLTSFIGGYLFVGPLNHVLWRTGVMPSNSLAPNVFFTVYANTFACSDIGCWVLLGVWGLLWIGGLIYQFKLARKDKDEQEKHKHYNV